MVRIIRLQRHSTRCHAASEGPINFFTNYRRQYQTRDDSAPLLQGLDVNRLETKNQNPLTMLRLQNTQPAFKAYYSAPTMALQKMSLSKNNITLLQTRNSHNCSRESACTHTRNCWTLVCHQAWSCNLCSLQVLVRLSRCSVLVSHGSLLKANCWELLGKRLNIVLELSNLWGHIGLQVCLEILQLGSVLLLEVLGDLHSPEHHNRTFLASKASFTDMNKAWMGQAQKTQSKSAHGAQGCRYAARYWSWHSVALIVNTHDASTLRKNKHHCKQKGSTS